ncbi:Scr1 family TA system antitoxin-like transcriptional regulator [Streptomyces sp. NPDC017202]|uniref:Scr1 family TA system antitoxin-like transcriptional regulator n=1 Tax=Streptomyces sp. NPDC017202 TaxID=3364981 RepID=UPI0037B9E888
MRAGHGGGGNGGANGTEAELSDSLKTFGAVLKTLREESSLTVEILVMPLRQEDHSGVDGQMYLAERDNHQWVGYVEGHDSSTLLSEPKLVSSMLQRYGKMRSQALSRMATVDLLREMQGAL